MPFNKEDAAIVDQGRCVFCGVFLQKLLSAQWGKTVVGAEMKQRNTKLKNKNKNLPNHFPRLHSSNNGFVPFLWQLRLLQQPATSNRRNPGIKTKVTIRSSPDSGIDFKFTVIFNFLFSNKINCSFFCKQIFFLNNRIFVLGSNYNCLEIKLLTSVD